LRSSVGGGSSGLLNAIFAAGEALSAFNEATEKHIVIITDGGFYDIDSLGDALRENMCLSIQTTIIGIEVTESDSAVIERLLVEYAGMSASDYYNVRDLSSLEVVVYNALLYIKHKRT